ncbi:sulfate ABC transporter permease subunit CysT [Turneriella parva]|uniref:Sulfate transport system permease protein CysT n=1 Tax=Turneriella parva (strain ATCC BAA-1111 / DSM 21527 / NCTC 11395 / H) TaxID=869212 RepID=I4BAQ9_TURPD|nr:sulfate ABC transporter permease subunit CysT [Turneriella parva]AFM14366.1 sulfate ABC transporter, inner membrane subunit CysT [Turneriella parva DSM 21527]
MTFRERSILPGFRLTFAWTVIYLSVIVLIPLGGMFAKSFSLGWGEFVEHAFAHRTLVSLRLSFTTALIAALINLFAGFVIAWVLTRYDFFGKRLLDTLVDLPFALPTAVAGIALCTVYAENGSLGAPLLKAGIKAAYNPVGITIALIFIGLPFVVRSVQPVLEDFEREIEEAAGSLGATRLQTIRLVILPSLIPALLSGTIMAFSRALGEYGSVIFIAGNIPFKSEIAPLIIVTKLEQHNVQGATAVAAIMLMISFALLVALNFLQIRQKRKAR